MVPQLGKNPPGGTDGELRSGGRVYLASHERPSAWSRSLGPSFPDLTKTRASNGASCVSKCTASRSARSDCIISRIWSFVGFTIRRGGQENHRAMQRGETLHNLANLVRRQHIRVSASLGTLPRKSRDRIRRDELMSQAMLEEGRHDVANLRLGYRPKTWANGAMPCTSVALGPTDVNERCHAAN